MVYGICFKAADLFSDAAVPVGRTGVLGGSQPKTLCRKYTENI